MFFVVTTQRMKVLRVATGNLVVVDVTYEVYQ